MGISKLQAIRILKKNSFFKNLEKKNKCKIIKLVKKTFPETINDYNEIKDQVENIINVLNYSFITAAIISKMIECEINNILNVKKMLTN